MTDAVIKRSLMIVLLAWLPLQAFAQDAETVQPPPDALAWAPHSGDDWVDRQLADINRYAERYREAFVDELVRYQGAPRALVEEMLADGGWQPGDAYFACAAAQAAGRACREAVAAWREDHAEGWGAVAARLGVEPRSGAFLRIKRGILDSYARWARPIEPDAQLKRLTRNAGGKRAAKAR